jgi:hypothetical protein
MTAGVTHDERLRVPWYWWPAGLVIGGLCAAEVHQDAPGVRAWIPYPVAALLIVAGLVWLGRVRVRVDGGELRIDGAHIGVEYLAAVEALDAEAKRRLLGVDADPSAFLVHRPWIGPAVKATLDDPRDPHPYWLISTRHPDRVVAAVEAAKERRSALPVDH